MTTSVASAKKPFRNDTVRLVESFFNKVPYRPTSRRFFTDGKAIYMAPTKKLPTLCLARGVLVTSNTGDFKAVLLHARRRSPVARQLVAIAKPIFNYSVPVYTCGPDILMTTSLNFTEAVDGSLVAMTGTDGPTITIRNARKHTLQEYLADLGLPAA